MRRFILWTCVVFLFPALLMWAGLLSHSPDAHATNMTGNATTTGNVQQQQSTVYEQGWASYQMAELETKRKTSGRPWMPFLQVPTLYCGVYSLPAGAKDGQSPHREDEVYYITAGKAKFEAGAGEKKETMSVQVGSVVYVKAGVPHRFLDIEEDLQALVFFSTAKESK